MKRQMEIQTMLITPELAQIFLDRNYEHNRKINRGKVEEFAEQMRRGVWRLSHQGIAISWEGKLIDGQHRLLAVIASGVIVAMVVAFNSNPDTYEVLDIGQKRPMTVALDTSSRKSAVAQTLFALPHAPSRYRAGSPDELREQLAWAEPIIDEITTEVPRIVRGRTSAPVVTGVLIRMLHSQEHHNYALAQYKALVDMSVREMTPAACILVQDLDHHGASPRINPWAITRRAFYSLDPAWAEQDGRPSRLTEGRADAIIDEMRATVAAFHERRNRIERALTPVVPVTLPEAGKGVAYYRISPGALMAKLQGEAGRMH